MGYKSLLERQGIYTWRELKQMKLKRHVSRINYKKVDWNKSPFWNVWYQFGIDLEDGHEKQFDPKAFTINKEALHLFLRRCRKHCMWIPPEFGIRFLMLPRKSAARFIDNSLGKLPTPVEKEEKDETENT